jgi:hypothetical protein
MPGLVPGIHASTTQLQVKDVDGRDKPSHDLAVGGVHSSA